MDMWLKLLRQLSVERFDQLESYPLSLLSVSCDLSRSQFVKAHHE